MARKKIPTGSVYRRKYKDRTGKIQQTKTWFLQYYIPGQPKPIRISSGTERFDDAVALLRQKIAKVPLKAKHTTDSDRVTVGQLLDLVIDDYRFHNRASTYDTQLRINKHLRPAFEHVRAKSVSTASIKRYVGDRKFQGASQATINKELAWLVRAFNLGYANEPRLVEQVPVINIPVVQNAREGVIPHEHYRTIRDLLPTYARIAFVISYYTGVRKGELQKLRIDKIQFENDRIELIPQTTKNKTGRYIPIYNHEMRSELERAVSQADPACPMLIQEDGAPVHEWRKSWRTAIRAAHLPEALFHDLRRTALTNMIHAGMRVEDAMRISGHKTRSVFERYNITSPEYEREQIRRLAEFMKKKDEYLDK
jgi:integrase